MILDSEEQRNVLLGIINSSTFVGQAVEQVFMLKQSIMSATLHNVPHNVPHSVQPKPELLDDAPVITIREE